MQRLLVLQHLGMLSLAAVMGLIAATRPVASAEEVAGGEKTRHDAFVLFQDFNWHDASGTGEYTFGADGYLSMDGSQGKIRCRRFLNKKIIDGRGGVEVTLRVVLGKRYHIRLFDQQDTPAVECMIDHDGWIQFRKHDQYVHSKQYVTFGQGLPSVDRAFSTPGWYARESDDMVLRFSDFDFANGTVTFTIKGPALDESVTMKGCLSIDARDISRLELQTGDVEPGTRIRLARYRQYEDGKLADHEAFPHHWKPLPAPPDGYPQDNMTKTTLRPVKNGWLETRTGYGWVRTSIPLVAEGELTFEMKTSNVDLEAVITLADSKKRSLLERLQETREQLISGAVLMGILDGKFVVIGPGSEHSDQLDKDFFVNSRTEFEKPIPVSHQAYRFKVAWFKAGNYHLWIDDVPMEVNGSRELPLCMRPGDGEFQGFDTILLHPGYATVRETLAEKKAGKRFFGPGPVTPLVSHWAGFRVKAHGP